MRASSAAAISPSRVRRAPLLSASARPADFSLDIIVLPVASPTSSIPASPFLPNLPLLRIRRE
ncbi:MAG: hypothetical protein RXS42_03345 [Nitrososphaeria archaeon]